MPTRAPSAARASARLTAVVDLPTPPLPEATAIMCLTPGRVWRVIEAALTAHSISISTEAALVWARSRAFTARLSDSR